MRCCLRVFQFSALLLPVFSAPLLAQIQHRIGVRVVNTAGELYDRQTNQRFTPRGNNFIRLAPQSDLHGATVTYMSMFNPGDYDAEDMELNLISMQASGYNVVKVWLNELTIGNTTGGLSAPYLDSLADFLGRAKAHNLYVIITIDDVPHSPEYQNLYALSCCALFANKNLDYLTMGGIQANQKFWPTLISGLQSRSAPFDNILSFEIREELFFEGAAPPLSLQTGTVTTANGKSYDMNSSTSKQQMMDDNLVYWIDSVRSSIIGVDPTALVSVGFFPPQQPNPTRIGDTRPIRTYPAIANSQADFIQLDAYSDMGLTLAQTVQNYELPAVNAKPIIVNEFGSAQWLFPSSTTAAQVFQQWEADSCQYGFSGWFLWNWDIEIQPGGPYWSALSGDGIINRALRPVNRPDPCQPGSYLGQNLALGATAIASASLSGNGPQMAVDGMSGTYWNSGGFPPQWIEIDLPHPSVVSGVRLSVQQAPLVGLTVHDVYVQTQGGQFQLVKEFSGITQEPQVLSWDADSPLVGVVAIRVETTTSPSWVAWKEIEIISGDPGSGCQYFLDAGGKVFSAIGGAGAVTVTTGQTCPWSVTGNAPWLSITGSSSGSGSGNVTYQVAPNSGPARWSVFTIGDLSFTVEQEAVVTPGLNLVGSMSHMAAEENWTTTFTLVNKDSASAQTRLSLFGDPSGTLALPLSVPQPPGLSGPLLGVSLDRTVVANGSLTITTAGPQTPPVLVGSAQLASTGTVDGFAIFHQIVTKQEAVVPMETRNASSYLLAFDNTNGLVLGVAVANISAQNAIIPVIIRDDAGNVISAPGTTISLGGNGHTSFVLSDPILGFPVAANIRGTIEFDTPAGGHISVLGLRFTPPNNALTTIPALANVGTGGGSIAHLASGGDGWQTTFVLVNAGTTATQVTLSFFNDQTGLPLPLPLSFPQSGTANIFLTTSTTQPLAAGATFIVVSSGFPQLLTGSAQLSTTGQVSGFVIFRHNNQEAVVPLESRNASGYIIAFDNTNSTATGIAINSVSTQAVNVPVIVRDDTGALIANDILNLTANGHSAFTLVTDKYPGTANIRGTIEFDTPAGAQIGALGIRIPPTQTYTTLPALAK